MNAQDQISIILKSNIPTAQKAVLIASLTQPTSAPATPARRAVPPIGYRAKGRTRCLTRDLRKAFVFDNPWAKGLSTTDIAVRIVEGAKVEGNWTLGEGYRRIAEERIAAR